MQRSTFLGCLACAAGASQLAAAQPALALDEMEVGRQVYDDLRDSGDLLFDSQYYEHLNEVGEVIAATVGKRYEVPLRFYIVKGDSPNAFSVPGGMIYINEPLLRMASNRDELGGVLAHESGHMIEHHVARHIAKMQTLGMIATIGTILTSIMVPGVGGYLAAQGADYASGTLLQGVDAAQSRHIESQADWVGSDIMAQSNHFNPWGMIWFFKKMTREFGPGQNFWLRNHPLDSTRIAGLEEHFKQNPAVFSKFKDTEAIDEVYW
ncbi:MAG: M48 family metalloprotease [Candidatus Eremiobacteraeota bacterium]|nr:M48 family metalloprotease [Candidatus Eremiobacteraeota bacterium]